MESSSDTNADSADVLREQCIRLLARREHSRRELARKLIQREYTLEQCEPILSDLEAEGLLSDERFTEAYVHQRLNAGYGPVRIRADLFDRGIAAELVNAYLDLPDEQWRERCAAAWARRFQHPPSDQRERGQQSRFLANRGFTGDHVRRVLDWASTEYDPSD